MSLNTNIKYDDFVGFTFAGTHSSELNVIRTSESNRFTDDLLPTFQDKVVQVGGRDGTYLFGSYYQRKEFPLSIAFDNVSEEDFRRIQNWGADKKVHQLIFDEKPYKYYNVKLAAPPQLKYICFDESDMNRERNKAGEADRRRRIYKGEGTFRFICYEPFARGTVKSADEIISTNIHHAKIYLNKHQEDDVPYEINLPEFDNISDAQLYLSSDFLYDRDIWGAPNRDKDGNLLQGQRDPYTGEASTSYYAYQPQKVLVKRGDGNSTAVLVSDYQTYLHPIDLRKGYSGSVDNRTLEVNGKLVENSDKLYNKHFFSQTNGEDWNHHFQRRAEFVQYDPQLKVTYDIAGKFTNENWPENYVEEYGCYTFQPIDSNEIGMILYPGENGQPDYISMRSNITQNPVIMDKYGNYWERIKLQYIPESYAHWEPDDLGIYQLKLVNSAQQNKQICQQIFVGVRSEGSSQNINEEYKPILFLMDYIKANKQNLEVDDYKRIFIVEDDTNIYHTIPHSIYFLPIGDTREYFLKCKYTDLSGEKHEIDFEIILDDEKYLPDEKQSIVWYYECLCTNYVEWSDTVKLPKTTGKWDGNSFQIKNCGDVDMPFIALFDEKFKKEGQYGGEFSDINLALNNDNTKQIHLKDVKLIGSDNGVAIDTELRIVKGYHKDWTHPEHTITFSNNIYDRYIVEGDYFYIPAGEQELKSTNSSKPEIQYEYRYF